jgi:hypothetical protein
MRPLARAVALLAICPLLGAPQDALASPDPPVQVPRPRELEARFSSPDSHPLALGLPTVSTPAALASPVRGCDAFRLPPAHLARLTRRLEAVAAEAARDPVLWLEAWTNDARAPVGATPVLSLRASHGGWLSVFWFGPDGTLAVPVRAVHLASGRDVELPVNGTLVAPAGRERLWAVLALERPAPPCGSGEALEAWLRARSRGPVAVARWELTSTVVGASGARSAQP